MDSRSLRYAILPRPGCATLTVGRESVTLDPTLPQEEFDRRKARWDELATGAFKTTFSSSEAAPNPHPLKGE